jgi:two-component system sensor histidine kinase/response regulator
VTDASFPNLNLAQEYGKNDNHLSSHYCRVLTAIHPFLTWSLQGLVFLGLIAALFPALLYAQTSPISQQINIPNKPAPTDFAQQESKSLKLSDSEERWLSKHQTIRLGIDPRFEPIEFIDDQGNYSGIASDYVKLLTAKLGISVQIMSDSNWSQALKLAKQGEIDLFAAITLTQDRENYLSFTRPYFKYPVVIYTRDDFPVISGLENLSRKKVTVVKDYFTHEMAKQHYPKLDLIVVDTIRDGLWAVSRGHADAYIGDTATATFEIRKHNIVKLKIAAPAGFESQGHAFAVRKDWPELASMINKLMDSITPEEHLEINNRWVQIKVNKISRYWSWIALGAVGLLLLFIMISAILRSQVTRKTAELRIKNDQLLNENSQRRQAEKALIDSEQRLAKFFHATFEIVFFHENGQILDVNPATTKLTGYMPEEVIGKNLLEFVTDDCKQNVVAWMNGDTAGPYETTIITKAGTVMPVEIHLSNFELNGRQLMVVGLLDITERKNSEQALHHSYAVLESRVQERTAELSLANSKLQELDRLKSLFIASVSHELRTPLNSIIGFSSLMKQATYGELNEKYTDYISRINLSGQHLLSLITDIIDISKIESGFVDVELSDFALDIMVNEAVDNLRQQAKKKGLTMEVTLPPKLTLHTDRRRLLQCLLNFLSNAIKYSEQGHITVLAEDKGKQVVLSVRDSGIGIKTEDMPLLFEAFERIDTHLRVKAGGTGLGLYLTNKIATELLQGEVGAISKTGKGSTFWIKIPKNLQQ